METTTEMTSPLYALWSKDICFEKDEKVDMEVLKFLMENPNIPKEDKLKMRAWSKAITNGCFVKVIYKLGKNVKAGDEMLGRLTALRGLGLQCFRREIRNALAHRNYFDIDISACHPTLCLQLCQKKGYAHKYQEQFLSQRKERIAELCEAADITPEEAKLRITSLYFGGGADHLTEFFHNLHTELSVVRPLIVSNSEYAPHLKFLSGRPNRMGVSLAYICQTHERDCLVAMSNAAAAHGRLLDVWIHDGALIRKREGETVFPQHLLTAMEKGIEEATGFKVSLVQKEMLCEWNLEHKVRDDAYEETKEDFEAHTFKLMDPAGFIHIDKKRGYLFKTKAQLILNLENKFVGEDAFLTRWVHDPDIKTYERLTFLPGKEADDDEFNIFTGFTMKPKEGDCEVFKMLLSRVVSHEPESVEYLTNYLAHMVQKPYEKPRAAIVIHGEKGVGKDLFFDAVGSLISPYFFNTSTPESDIVSNFNGCIARAIMVKYEEACLDITLKYKEKFKALITSPEMSFTNKGQDSTMLPSYVRLILTTNNVNCVPAETGERRWAMFSASSERKGDHEFWEKVVDDVERAGAKQAFLHYLMERDISGFNPTRFPKTQLLLDVNMTFIELHCRFFQRHMEINEEAIGFDFSARNLYRLMNEGREKAGSETSFGRMMRTYVAAGVVKKRMIGGTHHYSWTRVEMEDYLKKTNNWTEL